MFLAALGLLRRTADLYGLGVCHESLGLRDLPDGGGQDLQSLLSEHLYRGGLPEVCHVESGADLGVTGGGKHVVGTGCIIAGGDRGVIADEDRTCVPDLGERIQRIRGHDHQVLGCRIVHHLDGLVHGIRKDVSGVGECSLYP